MSASKECDIWHYWYFLRKGFKFQPNICNWSHDVLMMSMNLNNTSISNIKATDDCCIIRGISKRQAINIMQHLTEKSRTL